MAQAEPNFLRLYPTGIRGSRGPRRLRISLGMVPAARARAQGVTRAAVSMNLAAQEHPAALYAVGNAPTALLALCELLDRGLRPALIIGAPVGFVNVAESKEKILAACEKTAVPAIVATGRKGGSTVAAAICNALIYTAAGTLDPGDR